MAAPTRVQRVVWKVASGVTWGAPGGFRRLEPVFIGCGTSCEGVLTCGWSMVTVFPVEVILRSGADGSWGPRFPGAGMRMGFRGRLEGGVDRLVARAAMLR